LEHFDGSQVVVLNMLTQVNLPKAALT